MKVIKKEIELIQFENINGKIIETKEIFDFSSHGEFRNKKYKESFTVYITPLRAGDYHDSESISRETCNELLEYLGWDKI